MNAQTLTLQMSIIVEPDDDGSFHAYCPAFAELHVCGSTEPEAMKHVEDAIVVHLQSLVRHGEPLPCSTEPEAMKHVEDAIVVHLQSLVRHGEPLPCCSMKNESVPGGRPALRSAVFQFL